MYKSIIQMLENTTIKFPKKNVFESEKESISYNSFLEGCKKMQYIFKKNLHKMGYKIEVK